MENPCPDISVTELLHSWRAGNDRDFHELIESIYATLYKMARGRLVYKNQETLSPTALVNEAFLKLVQKRSFTFQNREQFLAVVSRIMREVLANHIRDRRAQKRGSDMAFLTFDDQKHDPGEALAVNDVMQAFAEREPRKAMIVELHYFAGLSFQEIAGALGLSERTILRDWKFARAWLFGTLKKGARP